MKIDEPYVQLTVRIPWSLKQWLDAHADKNRRSRNAEVLVLLEEYWRQQQGRAQQ